VQSNNGSGNPPENGGDHDDNIIRLPSREEREAAAHAKVTSPAMINLPPMTKYLVILLIGLHVILSLVVSPQQHYWVIEHFGFIPAYYSGGLAFDWPALTGLAGFSFLHGSWSHVLINAVMLAAFGAGLERYMGWRKMLLLMIACNIFALVVHVLFNFGSLNPVVGASGALSGLFAAALIMLQAQRGFLGNGKYKYLPLILLWVGISVAFGFIGGPGGETVAWAAHVGGFLAGFLFYKPIMRLPL
jgi:membrane associated rhomboid family serine protease